MMRITKLFNRDRVKRGLKPVSDTQVSAALIRAQRRTADQDVQKFLQQLNTRKKAMKVGVTR